MSKVLVTGGAGFIGSHVVERHILEGNNVVVVDDLSMGTVNNLIESDNLTFIHHSITDFDFMHNLLVTEKFDYIYLLAAVASVADTIARPTETHAVNQEANFFVLETIRKEKLSPKKVIFSSSAAVYGNLPKLPKSETDAVDPSTPYAIDKYATERFVLSYAKLYGISAAAVRFFNVYGPRQNPKSPYSGVLSIISDSLLNQKEFTLFGDGSQTRDFVYVKDVVAAMKLIEKSENTDGQVYNVATGTSRSLIDAIDALETASSRHLNVKNASERQGDIKDSASDITKLLDLGFRPSFSFENGISEYWESVERDGKDD